MSRRHFKLILVIVSFVTDLHEVFDYCFSICTHFNWTLTCKKTIFFLKTRTRKHYFVNIIWGNFGWRLNSSLFSLDMLSLDLVQVIKLLLIFIYFTVFRLSYWLLISNPLHNASGAIEIGALFNLAKTLVLVPHKKKMPSEEAQVQEGWRSSSRGSKTNPNFQLVNKPSWTTPHKVLQNCCHWLIQSFIYYSQTH